MKTFIASLMAAGVANAALDNCLYCRYTDLRASFLESWSYCTDSLECLADEWNYIDRDCVSGWTQANVMTLDFCEAEEAPCPEFVASK